MSNLDIIMLIIFVMAVGYGVRALIVLFSDGVAYRYSPNGLVRYTFYNPKGEPMRCELHGKIDGEWIPLADQAKGTALDDA